MERSINDNTRERNNRRERNMAELMKKLQNVEFEHTVKRGWDVVILGQGWGLFI